MNRDKAQIGMVPRNMPYLVIVIFSDELVKMNFHYYVWIAIYSVWLVAIDTQPEIVKKKYFPLLLLGM